MKFSPIIKILTLQSSIKIYEIKSFYFKHRLSKTTCLTRNMFLIFFSLYMGHKRNIRGINENSYRLNRYQYMLKYIRLSLSLREYAASDAESSVITFLLSLSAYSEMTEIKVLFAVCKPWCKRVLVWYPLARRHGLKQKYFQHCWLYPV